MASLHPIGLRFVLNLPVIAYIDAFGSIWIIKQKMYGIVFYKRLGSRHMLFIKKSNYKRVGYERDRL